MGNINLFFWIFGAEYVIYIMFFIIFVLGFKGKPNDKKSFLICLLTIPIALLIIRIIHLFYFEPRPFITLNFIPLVKEANNASFPSRHATISSVIAFSFLFFKSKWSPVFLAAALWIGFSRIYVGVHYPLDILGGFIVGIISLMIALQIKRLLKRFFLPV